MSPFLLLAIAALWVYLLWVLRRAELHAWRFLWGSMGLFILMMVGVRPWLTRPLARYVCAIAGVAGRLTGAFTAYFKYGILYIPAAESSVTLQVDFECSGVIEIMAFFSLLAFFNVYRTSEKVLVGLLGFAYIMVCNALRITLICWSVHLLGVEAYYIMHTFVGRIVFYLLSVWLYFYVFTKPQVVQMKVGRFSYELPKNNS
ncbi:exosortase family protein XrtG [Oscillibacter sp.]|uniref:exosortase family protein XrtG n=1 Tax=Oscillibacter sp. TaxID=1945593 RepID=UPI00216DC4D0|nr:exosortase family protein XrtG [Oscillibacter sp.]MCI9239880.1 exosortase family protein XrtG [Oscillibacter sp.]MCI9299331.1 exosortase family protein XrtG [Oscillibacter sp.]MCI9461095.1 exosortase family protein XrtG [Oscillibacter sp.]